VWHGEVLTERDPTAYFIGIGPDDLGVVSTYFAINTVAVKGWTIGPVFDFTSPHVNETLLGNLVGRSIHYGDVLTVAIIVLMTEDTALGV